MARSKGGRGKKALYSTSVLRYPLPLKDTFSVIISQYLESLERSQDNEYLAKLNEAIATLIDYDDLVILDDIEEDITPTNETILTLTDSQSKALENINLWIMSNDRFFRLSGYSGTGKSFLMGKVLACHSRLRTVAAAPTNKAAKNLRNILSNQGINCEVITIARLLNQLPKVDENKGKEIFESDSKPDFSGYDLIIFDEYSMIGSETFSQIKTAFEGTRTKGLFLGDPAQLPPINERISPIAKLNLDFQSTLTEVVRYDGEIARVAEEIRSQDIYRTKVYPFETTKDKTIICINNQQYKQLLRDYFLSDNFTQDTDFVRVLAFKNRTCDYHNSNIRKIIYGDNCNDFEIGDLLISKKPLFRKVLDGKGREKWRIIINNSEEMRVTRVGDRHFKTISGIDFQCYDLEIVTLDNLRTNVNVLTSEYKKQWEAFLNDFAIRAKEDRRLWKSYYDFIKCFDDLSFAYCLTVHKAQGSSIDNVILDLPDLASCNDRQQIVYTGITRAKKTAFVLQ